MDVHWSFCVPIFPARDVPAAQAWYRDVLGLGVNWIWKDDFGSVGMDHVELFLYESSEPRPGMCSLFVDDVDAVHARVVERGAEIVSPLEDKPWNVREFSVRDPAGNVLRIGTSVPAETPPAEFTFPEGSRA
jgi:catechol 2,3-dioxygenase-like lactoylglutathione lyase family enzyme